MTINKEFYSRSDAARLCVTRENGGRGLIGVSLRTTITHEETADPK